MLAGRLNLAKGSSGLKLWEKKHPEAAPALCEVAARRAQQDPTLRTIVTVHPPGNWRRGPTAPRSDGAAGRHGLALSRSLFGGEQTDLARSLAQHVTDVS